MVAAYDVRGAVSRAGSPLADHAEGADLRADRRTGGGGNDFAARGNRQRPELGLSILLAARCDLHALCPDDVRAYRGGESLARVALARRGGSGISDQYYVRPRWRAAADGIGAGLA